MKFDFLPKLRTYIIIMSVPLAMILVAAKAHGFGWLSLHPPEIEGGIEVTIENMKDDFFDHGKTNEHEKQNRADEEMRRFSEQMELSRRKHEERQVECDRKLKQLEEDRKWDEQEDARIRQEILRNRGKYPLEGFD